MATATMAYGERRFGAAYTVRILVALGALGVLAGLWGSQSARTSPHPALIWISIGLVGASAAVWIVLGKTVLTINDFGVRRESVFGQEEIAWAKLWKRATASLPLMCMRISDCWEPCLQCRASRQKRSSHWS